MPRMCCMVYSDAHACFWYAWHFIRYVIHTAFYRILNLIPKPTLYVGYDLFRKQCEV